MIDRKELISSHDPVLEEMDRESALTVGNGEFAFTADVTGMQTLYEEYDVLPLCTMSQWGWHTKPVSDDRYDYTLNDLVMTEYDVCDGRHVRYAKKKFPGNEDVYQWLRMNPHRLNLARIGFLYQGQRIRSEQLTCIHQELKLYEGILESRFLLDGIPCSVRTACHNQGKDQLAFRVESPALADGSLTVEIRFPYGSPDITASDWNAEDLHTTEAVSRAEQSILLKRQLDRDCYFVAISSDGVIGEQLAKHTLTVEAKGSVLELSAAFYAAFYAWDSMIGKYVDDSETIKKDNAGTAMEKWVESVSAIMEASRQGWKDFWEKGGIIRLNQSKDKRAWELERRIILSQYLMAVNSSGSTPPQETGLICNSWYGKMHLEMYLWHCAWLPLWNHCDLLERSLKWYKEHLPAARENARRNGYQGARWPKMIAAEGIDAPSPIATLLVWQQPHIIYMMEMRYQNQKSRAFLEEYWQVVEETAQFMTDFVVWNEEHGCYDIPAPVIPVQECHKETDTVNPAFEVEYWRVTLRMAAEWAKRLDKVPDARWQEVADHMAGLTVEDGVYLAHEKCHDTYTVYNKDHPSMLGAYGLIGSDRIDTGIMADTLHLVEKCWEYPTLWGWDFALMAMTAVRLDEPELAIRLLLKDTLKNCYLASGNNMQISRKDLPLYLPGNGSLLLAAAIMTAGYEGCDRELPGFPKDGNWTVEFENIQRLP
ncbi:MAG: glycoside hydrolase family 65 [Blautia sp.]|nr:glycoside hydrolase family 65 [Blautia sp.]